jgi:hypothetical protein
MNWMDLLEFTKQWARLCVLSLIAAAVQMYMSGKKFTFFHYVMSVLVAVFAAYLAAAFCEWRNFDEDLTTGVIGITAYAAPHILEGVNKLVQMIAQNPKAFLANLLKVK